MVARVTWYLFLVTLGAATLPGCTRIEYANPLDSRGSAWNPLTVELIGQSVLIHEAGTPFNDPGAQARDYDGTDLSSRITVTGSVDAATPGSYRLVYTVSNDRGETTSRERTVEVKSASEVSEKRPEIVLEGSQIMVITIGTSFTDPGARATDYQGNDISTTLVVTGTVDTGMIGSYQRTYAVTDAEGNYASIIRTVRVVQQGAQVDTVAPVLTLLGDNPLTLEYGAVYIEPGVSAIDETDGDISPSVVVEGSIDATIPGTYTVRYSVSDRTGNTAHAVRTVIVLEEDEPVTALPVVTLNGEPTMTLALGATFTDPGARAVDSKGNDLGAAITVSGKVDTATAGSYTLTYAATDADGNTGVARRTVIVAGSASVDTIAPVITLLGEATQTIALGATYTDAGATAYDETDGDITDRIRTTSEVTTATAGTWTVTYTVSDNAGNTATAIRRVTVEARADDTTPPVLALTGDNPLVITAGTVFTDPGATAYDETDGDLTVSITVSGTVDPAAPGTYTLTYRVEDRAGNEAVATRTVTVREAGAGTALTVNTFAVGSNSEIYTVGHYNQDGWIPEQIKVILKPPDGADALSGSITIDGSVLPLSNEHYKAFTIPNPPPGTAVTVTTSIDGAFEIGLGT